MSTKKFHIGLSVRGALKWPKAGLKGLLRHEDGRDMTPDEAYDVLLDELAQGHEVIPYGDDCDNWDWKKGCQGHEAKE